MLLREGTAGRIANSIVVDFRETGIRVDQSATVTQAEQGNLVLSSIIVFGNGNNFDSDAQSILDQGLWPNARVINPQIRAPHNWLNPDFRPTLTSPAVTGAVPVAPVPAGDPFLVQTAFIGANGRALTNSIDPDDLVLLLGAPDGPAIPGAPVGPQLFSYVTD